MTNQDLMRVRRGMLLRNTETGIIYVVVNVAKKRRVVQVILPWMWEEKRNADHPATIRPYSWYIRTDDYYNNIVERVA